MEFTEKVLIVSTGRFREADIWVRFISPTRGMMTAFAFGGCRSRKRFCGCLDVLNQVRFRVRSDRAGKYLSLMEGSLVSSPTRLRTDWERFGMAVNCIRFYEAVGCGADRDHDVYPLLISSLESLDSMDQVSCFFPVLFRVRLLKELGIAPDTEQCAECGVLLAPVQDENICHAPEPPREERYVHLAVDRGRFLCKDCARRFGADVPLGRSSFSLLKSIHCHAPGQWEELLPETSDRRELSRAMERYTRFHLGVAWDRGRFRRV